MRVGLLVSTVAAAAATAGCGALVVMMSTSGAGGTSTGSSQVPVAGAGSAIPVMLSPLARSSADGAEGAVTGSSPASPAVSPSTSSLSPSVSALSTAGAPNGGLPGSHSLPAPATSTALTTPSRPPAASTTKPKPPASTSHAPAPVRGVALPLGYSTGTATRVITVVSSGYSHTTATLQAWSKAPGGGWLRYGPAVTAHVGSAGMTTQPSEFESATPIGSFSLTQAFGRLSNPGTGLSYFQTTPSDWWISQKSTLYNTHQHCSSNCSFTLGSPNEHLYYETPFYNYAVVINTPSGLSAYPHGSAFFLHVTDGNPTAGCVAIPSSNLVTIMRWLTPSAHPRILIGVS